MGADGGGGDGGGLLQDLGRRALAPELTTREREALISAYYRPHRRRLCRAAGAMLLAHGHCLIVDGHSFPPAPLPFERDQGRDRADIICIGTDDFHTPGPVRESFAAAFGRAGFTVPIDRPFSGAIVPLEHYRLEPRIRSVMVEVNRALYLDGPTARTLPVLRADGWADLARLRRGRQDGAGVFRPDSAKQLLIT